MKKQRILIGIVVLIFCIGCSGCTENSILTYGEKVKFLGTWSWENNSKIKYIFYSNDTMYHISLFQNNYSR